MIRTSIIAGLCLCVLLTGCGDTTPPPPVVNPMIDARADAVLKSMSETLAAAEGFSVQASTVIDQPDETRYVRLHRQSMIHLRRPDRLYVTTVGDDVDRVTWYDGRRLTVLDRLTGEYAAMAAPDGVGAMLDAVMDRYGFALPAADLLLPDPYAALRTDIRSGEYLGARSVGGHRCHHLAFTQELIDWQIWIDSGPLPVPRKLLIVYKSEPDRPQYSLTLDEWNLTSASGEGVFMFHQPMGTRRIGMNELFGIVEGD